MAIVLGAVQAWTTRFDMNPDGVQYLDNAQAYWSGDFRHAVNSQWSPLYPWLIGALSIIARPAPFQEFLLVHLLNFFLYLLSLAGFLFFVASLRASCRRDRALDTGLLLVSYSAFLYCSLDFTNLGYVTPDLLVSLFSFVAAGLLIRMVAGTASMRHYAAFGLALGLGYLAKTPFLVFGVICLCMSYLLVRRPGGMLIGIRVSAVIFVAIVAPYAAVLSNATGRFTIGDSGKFNIVWHVNGVPNTNWQGGPAGSGRPLHPTRQLSATPAIFEFDGPVAGTYPPWYDPIYWNQGARIAFGPADFARAILEQIRLYGYLVYHRQAPLLFALLALFFLAPAKRSIPGKLQPVWPVLALGAAPFVMYAPVHAEARYLAPFFVLLWTALFTGLLRSVENLDRRIPLAISGTAALLMLAGTGAALSSSRADGSARAQYEMARSLETLGLKPGDRVAIVHGDLPYYWARLAGARITLEISFAGLACEDCPPIETQWERARNIALSHGAVFVIAPSIAGIVDRPGWLKLANTGAFVYRLRAAPRAHAPDGRRSIADRPRAAARRSAVASWEFAFET